MLTIAFIAVFTVVIRFIHELIQEDSVTHIKEVMDYEMEYYTNHKRRNVIQGIFRKHNQAFRDHGINGPKGTA